MVQSSHGTQLLRLMIPAVIHFLQEGLGFTTLKLPGFQWADAVVLSGVQILT